MLPAYMSYLSSGIDSRDVIACLGLISDTHMPDRCLALPASLTNVFRDVDMILHAGDVGALWVLDQLSAIAPVIAVHGNDELAGAQNALPYEQVIVVGGQRILLCHTHDPNRIAELELRKEDRWAPKLTRWAKFTERSEASMLVFGHTHIPMAVQQGNALLINPGAIASGSMITRQVYQTVALLFIRCDQKSIVVHVDLNAPQQPFDTTFDREAGFAAVSNRYSKSLFDPDIAASWSPMEARLRQVLVDPAMVPVFNVFLDLLRRSAYRHWENSTSTISRTELLDLLNEAGANPIVPASVIADFKMFLDA